MPDPTGRWVNRAQWQCPKCAWVNSSADQRCRQCEASVRPPASEPARPLDPLDLIGHDDSRVRDAGLVELATKAVHSLTRVTREKALALIDHSLRNSVNKRGEQSDQAWQAIIELPEDDRRAAYGHLVDNLEEEGYALYRLNEDGHG